MSLLPSSLFSLASLLSLSSVFSLLFSLHSSLFSLLSSLFSRLSSLFSLVCSLDRLHEILLSCVESIVLFCVLLHTSSLLDARSCRAHDSLRRRLNFCAGHFADEDYSCEVSIHVLLDHRNKNLVFLQSYVSNDIWRLQIDNRLSGCNLVTPKYYCNRTTYTRRYFTPEIRSTYREIIDNSDFALKCFSPLDLPSIHE